MTSLLLTAFEPFDRWTANASQLCLQRLDTPPVSGLQVTTRLYPVDFSLVRELVADDLRGEFDFALHLGQSGERDSIALEQFALNIGWHAGEPQEDAFTLEPDGPAAFRTDLPIGDWATALSSSGVATTVSFHAGTYLCNAIFYWSRYCAEKLRFRTRCGFVHLPLDPTQLVEKEFKRADTMPAAKTAEALLWILRRIAELG